MAQSVLLLALISTAISSTHSDLSESSACHDEAGTDASLSDETSLLQKTNRFKRQRGLQVEHSSGSTKPNIVYVRVAKTGSTTTAGALRKLAANNNISGSTSTLVWPSEGGEPGMWAVHGALSQDDFGDNPTNEPVTIVHGLPSLEAVQELKQPTFLMTVIRDPAARAMSKYYWNQEDPTAKPVGDKTSWLNKFENQQFRYVRMSAQSTLDEVFDTYDLIGMTERLDDTLVVLAAMLKVPLSDVLYMTSKNSSAGFVSPASNVSHGSHPSLSEEPADVKQVLEGSFRQANDLDYQLLQRANETLNAKIKELHLETAVRTFKPLLARAQADCQVEGTDKAAVQLLTQCYVADEGCNYECFNEKFNALGRAMCEWCDTTM